MARVDAVLPPGEGMAVPTLKSQGLLHGTGLNSYVVERRILGLGVQLWTSFFDGGLWASRGRTVLWEL